MSLEIIIVIALLVALAMAIALILILRGAGRVTHLVDEMAHIVGEQLDASNDAQSRAWERLERTMLDDSANQARGTRTELGSTLTQFQQAVVTQLATQLTSVAGVQNQQIEGFKQELARLVAGNTQQFDTIRESLQNQAQLAREEQGAALRRFGEVLQLQLGQLSEGNDRRLAEMRETIEQRLKEIETNNANKLEEMRRTVDEKLHATLEQRLGESFKLVSDRLEQVHRGLGEMQTLAAGVGDLKKVLSNVKTRGIWGEVQLEALLEQMLTPDQYAKNVATVPKSNERVEFAIRLPGRSGADGRFDAAQPVWLPIDAKFPREDYERLLDAQERADAAGVEEAARALEARVRAEARSISEKYVSPPHTTDFALLFLPTEGLYAEVLRRPGLSDLLQREYRVTVAGPTTLTALLNSLQMGFRTLAIEQRSSEVWQVLGAVKTEFSKFGAALAKTKAQLNTVAKSIELAERRTRVMSSKLKQVEALPGEVASELLGSEGAEEAEGAESGEAEEG